MTLPALKEPFPVEWERQRIAVLLPASTGTSSALLLPKVLS
jgi:hypothetical protein